MIRTHRSRTPAAFTTFGVLDERITRQQVARDHSHLIVRLLLGHLEQQRQLKFFLLPSHRGVVARPAAPCTINDSWRSVVVGPAARAEGEARRPATYEIAFSVAFVPAVFDG